MNKKEETLYKNLKVYLDNNIKYLGLVKNLIVTLENLDKIQSENNKIETDILGFGDKVRKLSFLSYSEDIVRKSTEINKQLQLLIK